MGSWLPKLHRTPVVFAHRGPRGGETFPYMMIVRHYHALPCVTLPYTTLHEFALLCTSTLQPTH